MFLYFIAESWFPLICVSVLMLQKRESSRWSFESWEDGRSLMMSVGILSLQWDTTKVWRGLDEGIMYTLQQKLNKIGLIEKF